MTGQPDDAALLAQARSGEVGAFAVLVLRHAPRLHAAARRGGAGAPDEVVVRTFARAMRRLDRAPDEDVPGWLLGLQQPRRRGDDQVAVPADEDGAVLPERTVDAIWAELAPRWPSGRRPVRPPRWLGQVALIALLLVLSVAIPYLLLVTAAEQDEAPGPLAELVAEPLEEDDWPDDPLAPDR
jgi:hypothetical protein